MAFPSPPLFLLLPSLFPPAPPSPFRCRSAAWHCRPAGSGRQLSRRAPPAKRWRRGMIPFRCSISEYVARNTRGDHTPGHFHTFTPPSLLRPSCVLVPPLPWHRAPRLRVGTGPARALRNVARCPHVRGTQPPSSLPLSSPSSSSLPLFLPLRLPLLPRERSSCSGALSSRGRSVRKDRIQV